MTGGHDKHRHGGRPAPGCHRLHRAMQDRDGKRNGLPFPSMGRATGFTPSAP